MENRVRNLEHDFKCNIKLPGPPRIRTDEAPTDSVRREMTRSYKDLRRFTLVLRHEGGKFSRAMFEAYWANRYIR